jgi:hypothetical protein
VPQIWYAEKRSKRTPAPMRTRPEMSMARRNAGDIRGRERDIEKGH